MFQEYSDKKDRDFVLENQKMKNTDFQDKVQECANIILSELDTDGVLVSDLDELLKSMGYSDRNIREAKHNLKESEFVEYKRIGLGGSYRMVRRK